MYGYSALVLLVFCVTGSNAISCYECDDRGQSPKFCQTLDVTNPGVTNNTDCGYCTSTRYYAPAALTGTVRTCDKTDSCEPSRTLNSSQEIDDETSCCDTELCLAEPSATKVRCHVCQEDTELDSHCTNFVNESRPQHRYSLFEIKNCFGCSIVQYSYPDVGITDTTRTCILQGTCTDYQQADRVNGNIEKGSCCYSDMCNTGIKMTFSLLTLFIGSVIRLL